MKVISPEPAASARTAPAAASSGRVPPGTARRALVVLTAAALFTGIRRLWDAAVVLHPPLAAVLMAGYGLVMAAAVAALATRSGRLLAGAEAVLLAVGVARTAAAVAAGPAGHAPYTSDEGVLVQQAAAALWHGGDIYRISYDLAHVAGVTKLMGGGIVTGFGYPPLAAVLAAPLTAIAPGLPAAALVSGAGLAATGLAMFALLPRAWRSAATLLVFGAGADLFMPSARQGYPTLVALPFLVPVVAHWTRTGRGGRLGRGGAARAVCLGLACAAQQLAWFLAPFLLVGLHRARRAELPPRAAALVTLRYAAVSGGAFLAVNLPFLLRDPAAWARGIAAPILQHAVPHGQGLVGISYYFRGGSGNLGAYSTAAALLLATALTALAVLPRRFGPAAVVLPWLAFYLSTRSQDGYYTLLTPLWLLSALTVRSADFAAAVRTRRAAVAGAVAVGVPAAAVLCCLGAAVLTAPPLRMAVTAVGAGQRPGTVERLTVLVANDSAAPVRPHFALTTTGPGLTGYWRVVSGPPGLAAHRTARYVLVSAHGPYRRGPRGAARLSAVTDDPMTVSTAGVPGGG